MANLKTRLTGTWRPILLQYGVFAIFCWFFLSFQVIYQKGLAPAQVLQRWVWNPTVKKFKDWENIWHDWKDHFRTRGEIIEENRRLRELVQRYQHLELAYRQMNRIVEENPVLQERPWLKLMDPIWARVLVHAPLGLETHEVLVDRGTDDGVEKNALVALSQGMIGYVRQAEPRVSRVWLVTHPYFAAGVRIFNPPAEGLLKGTGETDRMVLRYLPHGITLASGTEVFTSGMENIFPPMIPIGKVVRPLSSPEGDIVYEVEPVHNLRVLSWIMIFPYPGPDS